MRRVWLGICGAFLVAACGGGGGGPLPPIEITIDFQLVAADRPSTLSVFLANPHPDADTEVELAPGQDEIEGPFQPAPGALPGAVVAGGTFELRVLFTPPPPGAVGGGFTVRFRRGGFVQDVVLRFGAEVEELLPAVVAPLLDFGTVLIGEDNTLPFVVRNPGQKTGMNVTSITALPDGFTYVGAPPLPFPLAPGQTAAITVHYEPDALAAHEFEIVIGHDARGGPLRVDVRADTPTWIPRQVHEFGPVDVTNGETGWLEVFVPPHGVSLSLEARTDTGAVIGLRGLEGPDGTVYENDTATGTFVWYPSMDGVFSPTLPNSDNADVQLAPDGGTYRFRFFLMSGNATLLDVRAIVLNREGGGVIGGTLDLNVFLAPGLDITTGEAPTNERLQDILAEIDRILSQHHLRLGDIDYYRLNDGAYDEVTGAEFPDLLRESAIALEPRLNLFFVETAFGGGVLGVSATVGGPARNGTGASGVMSDFDLASVATAGYVAAHEIGHFLGLYHTTEQDGTHDIVEDTLECPPMGTDQICTRVGNDNLMHWHVLNVDPVITPGQAGAILVHPLVEQSGSALTAFRARPAPRVLTQPPPGWCGTPGCCTK